MCTLAAPYFTHKTYNYICYLVLLEYIQYNYFLFFQNLLYTVSVHIFTLCTCHVKYTCSISTQKTNTLFSRTTYGAFLFLINYFYYQSYLSYL